MMLEEFLGRIKPGVLLLGFSIKAESNKQRFPSDYFKGIPCFEGWVAAKEEEWRQEPTTMQIGTVWFSSHHKPVYVKTPQASEVVATWSHDKDKHLQEDPWSMWPGDLSKFRYGEPVGMLTGRVVLTYPDDIIYGATHTPLNTVARNIYVEMIRADSSLGFVMFGCDDINNQPIALL